MTECECGRRYSKMESPIWRCECGKIVIRSNLKKKYIIDFTVSKHGQFDMWAHNREEAEKKFKDWIEENKKETQQFIDHFTFDCEIKTNYTYVDGSHAYFSPT